MTPDVMHSWLMGRVGERTIRDFLRGLRLLILDEAHVYDGVFGTNMAYFLRRLEAVAAPHRLIVSTATIGDPGQFVARLTGRSVAVVAADLDGSASPQKTVFRIKPSGTDGFESLVALLVALSNLDASRFLAFGDSRKMIERVVAATLRARKPTTETEKARGMTRIRTPTSRKRSSGSFRTAPATSRATARRFSGHCPTGRSRASSPRARSRWGSTSARSTPS